MAKKPSTALSTPSRGAGAMSVPAYVKQGSTRGVEKVSTTAATRPFLRLAQDKTKQVEDEVKGFKKGVFFDSATNHIFGSEIEFQVVMGREGQMRWGKYGSKDGILCQSLDGVTALAMNGKNDKGKPTNDCASCVLAKWDGDTPPVCSRQGVYLVLVKGYESPLILVLEKTNFSAAKQLNSALLTSNTDAFALKFKAGSTKGKKSLIWSITRDGYASKDEYARGEQVYEGMKKIFFKQQVEEAAE